MQKISAIVCTYNRCESLRDTLQALRDQVVGDGVQLDIIVVDNNSTDQTKRVVEEAAIVSVWPIRYLFEPQQGLCYARNQGIREARGDVLAFTDDDVIPESNWVQALVDTFANDHIDCVGGKVLPMWLSAPPAWLAADRGGDLWGMLAMLDHDQEIRLMDRPSQNFIFGANMAFRAKVFHDVGMFRTDLGPKGHVALRGDDTEIVDRIFQAGKRIVYTPHAVVRHKVPAERMNKAYFRQWKFHAGRSLARFSGVQDRHLSIWAIRECVTSGAQALVAYCCLQPDRYAKELAFLVRFGRIIGSLESR